MTSIQRRLTIALALLCCTLWSAGGIALYLLLRAGLVGEFDHTSHVTVQRLAALTERTEGGPAFDASGDPLPAFEPGDRPDYFQIWLPDGSTLAQSPSLAPIAALPRDAGAPEAPRYLNVSLPNGRSGRAAGIRFVPHDDDEAPANTRAPQREDEVTLVVARDRGDLDDRLRQLATMLVMVGLTTAVAVSVVGGMLVRRGLRPLATLAAHAAAIDASSLGSQFPTDHMRAELLPIAQRLNDLLARLDASFARERRFSADVAHELRTPIAELRTLSEVALRWPDDAGASRSALQDALAVSLQMESVVTGLLALARCEGGLLSVRGETVAIDAMVRELWQSVSELARDKKLSVTFDLPSEATWHTDPVALRVIVGNVFANAVQYAPAEGDIRVVFEDTQDTRVLSVSNTTAHLQPHDLSHLFERFWRKDPSRASTGHTGLGLALAVAYAKALGMRLNATMTGDAVITIELSDRHPDPSASAASVA